MPSNSSDGEKATRGRRLWAALHGFFRSPLKGILALVAVVVVLGLTFAGAEELNIRGNSTEFCVSCHSMNAYVYEEFKQSTHYTNASGVRPECGDCHVAKRFFPAVWDHVMGTHDLISELSNDWSSIEKFDAKRTKMAEKARLKMLNEDSHTCRSCHNFDAIAPTRKRGERAHADAKQKGRTNCIACHYNLVHKEAPLTERFSQAIKGFGG